MTTYRELKIKESAGYTTVGDPRTKPHVDATTSVHGIADTSALATKTYADTAAASAAAAVVDSAPSTLDTLNELAAALGDDPNFATTTATALGNRVRFDASQSLTSEQQTQARTNIGAVSTSDSRLTDARTPSDGSVATAKIVDGAVTNAKLANSGITINGSSVSLGGSVSITGLPTQTSNSGKFLTTDGTSASWAAIVGGATVSATAPSSPTTGMLWLDSETGVVYAYYGTSWIDISGAATLPDGSVTTAKIASTAVTTANIADGAVTAAKLAAGAAVPTQTGQSGKYLTTDGTTVSWATVDLSTKANIASPTFTGVPAAPTASAGTNTTQVATTAFVTAADALKADVISETTTDYTLSSNVLTFNLSNGNVGYIATAPTAAMTFNFTNAPTTDGKSISVSVFVTQGATGYIPTTVQIAGSGQTIKWAGGSAPTATNGAGKIDVFSFTLIRRSSAWTVLGSALGNF